MQDCQERGCICKSKSKIVPKKKDTTSDSEVINILRKFDAFVDEHKNDEYEMADGEIGLLGEAGGNIYM